MIKLKNILVPTDFSEYSKYALNYAIAFAQNFKARIILTYITPEWEMDSDPIRLASAYLQPGQLQELLRRRESEDRRQLEEFIPPELKKGMEVETVHKVGTPFLEIIRTAKEREVDLIVIGTHGRSGLSHMFFGSVAEQVVRNASCPVLSIRHPEHEFVMP
jgi:nucleotide-binding universal stress UspA family protein